MANLAEASTWDTVYQLESTDQALAGAGGTMNRQAQALLNRTKFLADTKLNTTDFSSTLKTQINASGTAPIYACRAWVNFNGVGTIAIRSSGNVSSITDGGAGLYTVNFTTAMQDANYVMTQACSREAIATGLSAYINAQLTTSVSMDIRSGGGTITDTSIVCLAFFR